MLWGAFNNASTAMQVFTTDLGSISQNIANVNTTGYKRQEMMFSTLMSEHHAAPTSYLNGLNIFGVQATQRNLIEAQGVIAPSTTWSDLAINGKGFFMVAPPSVGAANRGTNSSSSSSSATLGSNVPTNINTDDPSSVMYTRDGAWHRAYGPDTDSTLARSYFLNNQGGYLLGYMADATGKISSSAKLEPVYTLAPRPIANNGTAAVDPTSTLNPTQVTMPGRATTLSKVLANLPRDATLGGNETQITVKDGLGNDQPVTLKWTRTGAYSYDVTASTPHATLDTSTWSVTVDDTGKVTSPTTMPSPNFTWDATGGGVTNSRSVSLSTAPKRGDIQNIPITVYDSNFTQRTVSLRFERVGSNTWYMMPDGGADVTANPAPVQLTFDGNGKLVTPATGLSSLNMSWKANTTNNTPAGTASFNVDINKLTQYDGTDVYIGNVGQDGYGRGNLISTSFNDVGELNGYFDNGFSRVLFKVPVANFVADNSLEAVSGTMFRRTAQAGDLTVSNIEDAPGEGRFSVSSLENSTVDIEDEFTRMIMTQKAYSMNSQVFKTADEMTTTARDLKG
jgi:flagellar hook protein FlgE